MALFSVLLLVALVVFGFVALTLLRRTLVQEVDSQLRSAAETIVINSVNALPNPGGPGPIPTDYAVVIANLDGSVAWQSASGATAAFPDVGDLSLGHVQEQSRHPYTVGSEDGPVRWRVVAGPVVRDGAPIATAAVALPLTSVEATMSEMRTWLLVVSAAVLAGAAGAGYVVVRRSLRPLRRIESTAAAIAGGDLSQRVPPEPPTTEVGSLSRSLNMMLGQVEASFAQRTASERRMQRFVSDASHELRTPLAAMRGYAELYRLGGIPDDDVPQVMERLERESVRMGSLVNDLLALARLDEGRGLRLGQVDLAQLAADAAEDLRAIDPARTVRVEAPDADGDGWAVEGDADQLRQVMLNLIGNVASYTPAGSPVELVLARPTADAVVLEVVDHGPGIAPDDAARVFDRFYRVETSRSRSAGGSGLGLAIVAAIVGAHGGAVSVVPTPDGGTTVRIELPVRPGRSAS
ncbi:sensor histidine kinase [Beutenbergia cavernae]|uniref:sensor histidine kinase n=1 Tax=Beutenbergia cavernae TaxID=84757 RepID=UPI00117FE7E8|nr:HAMP domain-containing sensor histidine kinase [Beutenbergia cavernae]